LFGPAWVGVEDCVLFVGCGVDSAVGVCEGGFCSCGSDVGADEVGHGLGLPVAGISFFRGRCFGGDDGFPAHRWRVVGVSRSFRALLLLFARVPVWWVW